MRRHLLDVNVLLALFDEDHAFHQRAHDWFSTDGDEWSSTALTENGLIRILANPNYSPDRRLSVADVGARLRDFRNQTNHEFWPNAVSFCDPETFELARVLGSRQITDVYLLAVATHHEGCLVTFDQGISLAAVVGAESSNLIVL